MLYPPVAHMMAVMVMSENELTSVERATNLADKVKFEFLEYKPRIIGPSSAAIGKINDIYRNVFYIKHKDYNVLVEIKDELESFIDEKQWNRDSIQFDFNPMNM